MKTRKVLIPIDGSEFSHQVLPHVMRLFDPNCTELVLMRVAPRLSSLEVHDHTEQPQIYSDQREAAMAANFYAEMLPTMRKLADAGFTVSTAMCFGDPAEQIEQFVVLEGIDLVAMTTHGRTGLARLLLGSVAQHVVTHAPVPVLLWRPIEEGIPEAAEREPVREVAV